MSINTYQLNPASNNPQGSDFMDATAGPTYLVTELQTLKADARQQSLDKTWRSLNGLLGIWTGGLVWSVVSGTQATIQGDQTVATGTGYVIVGGRVEALVTAGKINGTITAAVAGGGNTTCTFAWDTGALDSGLSDIKLALDLSKVISIAPSNYAVITNIASAWTGAISPAILAYVQGAQYRVRWSAASQGADTIALNGLAAITVKKVLNGALVNLAAGDIPLGDITDVIYDSAGPSLIIVSGPGSNKRVTAYKATDQTVPSSTTLVDDNTLSFPIAASEVWSFELDLFATFDSVAASGIKATITVPSGCTIQFTEITSQVNVVTTSGTAQVLALGGGAGSGKYMGKIIGQAINGATPGTVLLRWAQNTSNATATALKAGSSLLATKMSA